MFNRRKTKPVDDLTEQDNSLKEQIFTHIKGTGYSVTEFTIDNNIFGNMILTLVSNGKEKLHFVTDRGEIYCNGILLSDSFYHIEGNKDTSAKLLDVIVKKLLWVVNIIRKRCWYV